DPPKMTVTLSNIHLASQICHVQFAQHLKPIGLVPFASKLSMIITEKQKMSIPERPLPHFSTLSPPTHYYPVHSPVHSIKSHRPKYHLNRHRDSTTKAIISHN